VRQIIFEVMEETESKSNRKYALQLVRQELEGLHKRWFNYPNLKTPPRKRRMASKLSIGSTKTPKALSAT
jgi:hypothetical protein